MSAIQQAMTAAATIEQISVRWEQRVLAANRRQDSLAVIRAVRASVLIRARKISNQSGLNTEEVAKFLLEKTALWAEAGKPLRTIAESLPKDLRELGIMKMAEDMDEVRRIMGRAN